MRGRHTRRVGCAARARARESSAAISCAACRSINFRNKAVRWRARLGDAIDAERLAIFGELREELGECGGQG